MKQFILAFALCAGLAYSGMSQNITNEAARLEAERRVQGSRRAPQRRALIPKNIPPPRKKPSPCKLTCSPASEGTIPPRRRIFRLPQSRNQGPHARRNLIAGSRTAGSTPARLTANFSSSIPASAIYGFAIPSSEPAALIRPDKSRPGTEKAGTYHRHQKGRRR